MDLVRSDQNVAFVEVEHIMQALPDEDSTGVERMNGSSRQVRAKKREETSGQPAPHYPTAVTPEAGYNLQMIGAGRKLDIPVTDGDGDYRMISDAGRGVDIYILDTGIRITHELFQNRASNFGGLASTDLSPWCPGRQIMDDQNGHGTA